MNKTKPKIKDIEVDGNTVRFISVPKDKTREQNILVIRPIVYVPRE